MDVYKYNCVDKLPPAHHHLCLKCQEPYTLYYFGEWADVTYICHCGEERDFRKEKDNANGNTHQ